MIAREGPGRRNGLIAPSIPAAILLLLPFVSARASDVETRDAEFLRRVSLDITGTLPTSAPTPTPIDSR